MNTPRNDSTTVVEEVVGGNFAGGVEASSCDKHPESYEEEPGEMSSGSVSLDKRKILTGDWVWKLSLTGVDGSPAREVDLKLVDLLRVIDLFTRAVEDGAR